MLWKVSRKLGFLFACVHTAHGRRHACKITPSIHATYKSNRDAIARESSICVTTAFVKSASRLVVVFLYKLV